jgi:hypothetical protein
MQKYLISFLFLALASAGCMKLGTVLNWADTYALSTLSDYFDLNSEQKKQAKKEINDTLRQIEKNEFPAFAAILQDAASQIEKGEWNEEAIEKSIYTAQSLINKAYARFEPLAQRLVEEQASVLGFARFDEAFEKKHRKNLEISSSAKEQSNVYKKRFGKWVSETVEFSTPEQEDAWDEFTSKDPYPSSLKLQSHKVVFEKFKATRLNKEARTEFIHLCFTDWLGLQTSPYQQAQAKYREGLRHWIVTQLEKLTDKQKKNLIENLRKRAQELQDLAQNAA